MNEPATVRGPVRSVVWYAPFVCSCVMGLAACAENSGDAADSWDGTVDTLPNGAIEVHNPSHGIWDSATTWQVIEEVRIGSLEGTGPDLFGRISALEVDKTGRFYVFESQAQEIRVFEPSGEYVRTIGREGGGRVSSERESVWPGRLTAISGSSILATRGFRSSTPPGPT